MRKLALVLCTVLALTWGAVPASADTIGLWDYGFNINGTLYPGSAPAFANTAGFDFLTGLGSITLDFRPGASGTFDILAFFDHDVTGTVPSNPFDNEFGEVFGVPGAGLTWEIDDPANGDIILNMVAGGLDNMILNGAGPGPSDISMAMGFNFTIPDAGKRALITLNLTTAPPSGGFYLHQWDPAGDNIYLSSPTGVIISDIPGGVVPEPASLLLVGTGLALGFRKLRRR